VLALGVLGGGLYALLAPSKAPAPPPVTNTASTLHRTRVGRQRSHRRGSGSAPLDSGTTSAAHAVRTLRPGT
jgi:hypothetical protein